MEGRFAKNERSPATMLRRKTIVALICVLAILCIGILLLLIRPADREAPLQMEMLPAPILAPEAE